MLLLLLQLTIWWLWIMGMNPMFLPSTIISLTASSLRNCSRTSLAEVYIFIHNDTAEVTWLFAFCFFFTFCFVINDVVLAHLCLFGFHGNGIFRAGNWDFDESEFWGHFNLNIDEVFVYKPKKKKKKGKKGMPTWYFSAKVVCLHVHNVEDWKNEKFGCGVCRLLIIFMVLNLLMQWPLQKMGWGLWSIWVWVIINRPATKPVYVTFFSLPMNVFNFKKKFSESYHFSFWKINKECN